MKTYIYLKKYPRDKNGLIRVPHIELKKKKDRIILNWIAVPDSLRRKGLAVKLLKELFKYMKINKIEQVQFTNLNKEFWHCISKKFPKNIMLKDMCGEITV